MKLFAYFLPQYHCIPENDEWWGKGFTEWVNVKKAKPLYEGHVQPKHPLGDNYYNLLEKKTVIWQTDLMKQYGVDGLIYYHYYFKGRLLLEKPAENLLKWKDIDQPFFFCWANHTWNRSWNGTRELLLKQEYGNRDDWEKHFQYLLPFFTDNRYEKINNKPVFMLFQDFGEKKEMFTYFDKRCKESGFAGIHIIETCCSRNHDDYEKILNNKSLQTSNILIREPDASRDAYLDSKKKWYTDYIKRIRERLERHRFRFPVKRYNGDTLYDIILEKRIEDKYTIQGIFFQWDNTPRHSSRGYIISSVSKEKFFKVMDQYQNDKYIVINAWNEWAEGMMLEPTKEEEYKYLKWIREWKNRRCD